MRHDDDWLEATLKSLIGVVAWKMSSWSDLATKVDSNQTYFVNGLQDAIDPEFSANTHITDVRLVVLTGRCDPAGYPPRTGVWAWLPDGTPRIWQHVDHLGHPFGGRTAVNAGTDTNMAPIPSLPSMRELGMEDELQQLNERVEASGDTYVIRLNHTYCVTQYRPQGPPHGQWKWECEMVLLTIKVASRRDVVLQVSASEPDEGGNAIVSAMNMGGDELCSVRLNFADSDVASLLAVLATQCQHDERVLRLVFCDGAMADWKSGHVKLASLFKPEGQTRTDAPHVD